MHCAVHPEVETSLSCSVCGRSICPDCAQHTSVGTRCLVCAGATPKYNLEQQLLSLQKRGPVLNPTPRTLSRCAIAVLMTLLLNLLFAPFVLLPLMMLIVICSLRYHLRGTGPLLVGLLYFVGIWIFLLPTFGYGFSSNGVEHTFWSSLLFVFLSLLLLPFLWSPAKVSAVAFLDRGRGFISGVTIGSAISAVGISIITSLALLFSSL